MLTGRRLLLIEDDFFIASELVEFFTEQGVEIVGPVGTLEDAMQLATLNSVDAAVVDINLHGKMAYPVADLLVARGTPFVFSTGYDIGAIPEQYRWVTRCVKPVDPAAIAKALFPATRD